MTASHNAAYPIAKARGLRGEFSVKASCLAAWLHPCLELVDGLEPPTG